jgi:hypothetical protein
MTETTDMSGRISVAAFLWGCVGWICTFLFFWLSNWIMPTAYICEIVGAIFAGVSTVVMMRKRKTKG